MKKKNLSERRIREVLSDSLLIAGGAAVSVGMGLLHIAAGVITGGIIAILFGWLIGQGGTEK